MENNNTPIFETGEVKKENVYGSCKRCGKPIPYGIEYCDDCLKEINDSKKKAKSKTLVTSIVAVVLVVAIAFFVALFLNRNGKNNWKEDSNGVLHYYGANGKMATNKLINDAGNTYYVDKDGAKVVKDWAQIDDKFYYLDKDGVAVKDRWEMIDDKWYAFDKEGVMLSNTWKDGDDGIRYYLGPDGDMQTNTICDIGGSSYYFDSDGVIKVNTLVNANGGVYYAGTDGIIEKNKWVANNTYYAGDDGKILTNTITPDGVQVDSSGKRKVSSSGSSGSGTTYNDLSSGGTVVKPIDKKTDVIEVDMSKAVWITGYETFTSYMDFEEEKTVDISIKYPIFGGQDQSEVDAMNACINELTSDMEALANDEITMEESPRKYSITTAEVSNIETNKINVILKGKLERSGKAAKDVRIRFIYDRQSRTAFVKD